MLRVDEDGGTSFCTWQAKAEIETALLDSRTRHSMRADTHHCSYGSCGFEKQARISRWPASEGAYSTLRISRNAVRVGSSLPSVREPVLRS